MYLGRFFLGEVVPLSIQTQNASGTPTAPDNPPYVDIRSTAALIQQVQLPILDRYSVTGVFLYPLRLSSSYTTGRYTATYYAKAGGHHNLEVDTFEIVAGGDADGAILTQFYWARPEAIFLVQQTEAANLLLRRNPSVS